MSSIETPPDPDEPEPTDKDARIAFRGWLLWTSVLFALAIATIGYGQATGKLQFF
jgi:hypothetical protein